MTTLYKPVLIESAERAEALPIGTVATVTGGADAAVRVAFGNGWSVSGDELTDASEHMIGWTALVPIEAEEEHGARGDGEVEDFYLTRRLVTPWEAV